MGLYDALRDAGVDLLRAHRLDAYLRAIGDDALSDGFARALQGERADVTHLRAALVADLDGIVAGLALLDTAARNLRCGPDVGRNERPTSGPKPAPVTVSRPVSGIL